MHRISNGKFMRLVLTQQGELLNLAETNLWSYYMGRIKPTWETGCS